MNEKSLSVLDKYEFKIKATKRVRGSYYCDTDKGLLLLSECDNGKSRLELISEVQQELERKDIETDSLIRNTEGELFSVGPDGGYYILRKWYDHRECDVEDVDDYLRLARCMALFHLNTDNLENVVSSELVMTPVHIGEIYSKHTRELIKTKSFIHKMKKRTDFEVQLERKLDLYCKQAFDATEELAKIDYQSMIDEAEGKKTMCHGNSQYHNFLITNSDVVLVNYNKINNGPQIRDVYIFLKKAMEKNDFDISIAGKILDEYNKIRPITNQELAVLKVMFLYPEKFWKVVNSYINSKKAWVSEKNREKLEQIQLQETYRDKFISVMSKL